METIRNLRIMQETTSGWLRKGKSIGFVPTMGALHEGHLSLVRRAKGENDVTVVSIFVNPLQFGPEEDYQQYPREIERDSEKLLSEGVDVLFIPSAEEMYPEDFATVVSVRGLSEKLCGQYRPGHFDGVATVVTKLFNIVRPTRAYFGQKDYQQSLIIKQFVRDLNIPVDIIVCPIVREKDGLAMSSRNQYLKEDERKAAANIYKALKDAEDIIKKGGPFREAREVMIKRLRNEPLIRQVDYASIYDPESLDDISNTEDFRGNNVLLAVAVRIGMARLIDNILVEVRQ